LDTLGNYDAFTVLAVDETQLSLRHHGAGSASTYPVGTPVLPVVASTFSLDPETQILRTYDGDASDLPLLDDVVGGEVRYYGERRGPRSPKPAAGIANCLYDVDGTHRSALLPVFEGPGGSDVPLAAGVLTDGPWCGSGANQFDADLLRVRRVRITLRLQASDPSLRGTDPSRYRRPGHARDSAAAVPDATTVVDVTLRNRPGAW
jgi:hypothetical protein